MVVFGSESQGPNVVKMRAFGHSSITAAMRALPAASASARHCAMSGQTQLAGGTPAGGWLQPQVAGLLSGHM